MEKCLRPAGFFLFVIFIFLFGSVNESMSAKPQADGGYYHTLLVKSDGTLWAWGGNTAGQLGDGTTDSRNSPIQIGDDNKWVAVSAGLYHSLGLKSDGTLWVWGGNIAGQLGDGTTDSRNSPVQIGDDNKWVAVSAGLYHSLGLKSDGTLWAWGGNTAGQLGDGTTDSRNSPVLIGSDNKWVTVSAGGIITASASSRMERSGPGEGIPLVN